MKLQVRAFLDDVRPFPERSDTNWDGFDILWRSVEDAINYCLENGVPDFISFDHDLGQYELEGSLYNRASGLDFAKWLVNHDLETGGKFLPEGFDFTVHSANPVGARNIESYLSQYIAIHRPIYSDKR